MECSSQYEYYILTYSMHFIALWSPSSKIVFFLPPQTLCFNNLPGLSYRKQIPLGPLPSCFLQEWIPSINSSFYLIFNPSCSLGFFTKARNKPSGSTLKWACVQGHPYVCAHAHTHARVHTHMFLQSQANTPAFLASDCMCRFYNSSPESLKGYIYI